MEIIKTVKQHSLYVEDITELKHIAERYRCVKNYVYSRYSGINSIPLINKHRQLIRDEWVITKFAKQWGLPARYWKLALDEAVGDIKSQWSNVKRKIKECINHNENITKDELHYIRYILKSDDLYYKVLTYKELNTHDKFNSVRFKYVNNLIRRLTRKYKGNIPYSYNARSFMIDAEAIN